MVLGVSRSVVSLQRWGWPQALFLDLDGTLIDSSPGILASLKCAACEAGVDLPELDAGAVIGPPLVEMVEAIMPEVDEEARARVVERFRYHYDDRGFRASTPYETVSDGLHELRSMGLELFVLTNKRQAIAERVIIHHGWQSIFKGIDGTAITEDSGRSWPVTSGKCIRGERLAARHSLQRVWVVGDGLDDWQAANHLCGRFLLASWGYGTNQVMHAAPNVEQLEAFSDLPKLLREVGKSQP